MSRVTYLENRKNNGCKILNIKFSTSIIYEELQNIREYEDPKTNQRLSEHETK